jgi:hypothetical protein
MILKILSPLIHTFLYTCQSVENFHHKIHQVYVSWSAGTLLNNLFAILQISNFLMIPFLFLLNVPCAIFVLCDTTAAAHLAWYEFPNA